MDVRERERGPEGQKPSPMEMIRRVLRGAIKPVMSGEFGEGIGVLGAGFLIEMYPLQRRVVVRSGVNIVINLHHVTHGRVGSSGVAFVADNGRGDERTLIIGRDGKIEILPGEDGSREGIIEEDPVLRVHEGVGAGPDIVDAKFTIITSKGNTQRVLAIGRRSKLERLRLGDRVILRGRTCNDDGEAEVFLAKKIALIFAF